MAAAEVSNRRSILERSVVIPRRHAVGRRVRNVVIRARFRSLQKARVPAVFVRGREAVERPCQPTRPAGIAAITLVRGLPEKLAGLQIEYAFVGDGAVSSNQKPPRREAMSHRNIAKSFVVQLARRIEDHSDIHHDVDENGIFRNERAQILPFVVKSLARVLAACSTTSFAEAVSRQQVPSIVSRKKDKSQVVNIAIRFPCLRAAYVYRIAWSSHHFASGFSPPRCRAKMNIVPGRNPSHHGIQTGPSCFHLPACVYIG